MYRNCSYNSRAKQIHLFTWDQNGGRVRYDLDFKPYLYVEDPRGDKTSIFGTKLRKKVFDSTYDRNQFVKDSGTKRLFENLSATQQFLLDNYWLENDKPEFVANPLKICYIDIENDTHDYKNEHTVRCKAKTDTSSERNVKLGEYRDKQLYETHDVWDIEQNEWLDYLKSCYATKTSFPSVENPEHPINLITCFDSFTKKYTTFGIKILEKEIENVDYVYCRSEKELFHRLVEYLEEDYPDVLSGFNSDNYDIPYIVRRAEKILGEDFVKRFSPVGNVYSRTFMGKFGKELMRYYFDGVSCLDYLEIYKRFCLEPRESYKLNAVAEVELGIQKVDYGDISIAVLGVTDWQKFVEYNIQDVNIIIKLEDKLRYIDLLRMLAYTGLTTLEGAMGTLSVINGAIAIKARKKNEIISTFIRNEYEGKNPGAFVAEPKQGLQTNIVSFDANSLYPNVMISLNLSPETKVGKIERAGENIIVQHISGKKFDLTKEKFGMFLKQEQLAITKAGFLFTQKKKGLLPEFLEDQLDSRIKDKSEMLAKKKQLAELKTKANYDSRLAASLALDISRLHSSQLVKKILANSAYGYLGNKQAPMGDDDIASSVTLTGQAVIKGAAKIVQNFLTSEYNIVDQETLDKSWVYSDTDSCYFSLDCIKDKVELLQNDTVSPAFFQVVEKLESVLNTEIQKWAKKELRTENCTLKFKRECISDVGLFLQKKRYVLHVLNDEGIPVNKFKYVGVSVVRSTMPNSIKPHCKRIIETMLMTRSNQTTNKVINEIYDLFKTMPPEEVAVVSGIQNYEAYAAKCKEFSTVKNMPHHVKAAYFYNTLLNKYNIQQKYEAISSGDKMKIVHVQKPNKYNLNTVGFKYEFPKEFEKDFTINHEVMFEKIVYSMVESFYEAVGWSIRKPTENVRTELFDLFA